MTEPTYVPYIAKDGKMIFTFEFEGHGSFAWKTDEGDWICVIRLPDTLIVDECHHIKIKGTTRAVAVFRAMLEHKTITLKETLCLQKI